MAIKIGKRTVDLNEILKVDVDPSGGAGTPAEQGSLAMLNDSGVGKLFLKTLAGDVDWEQFLTSSSVGNAANTYYVAQNGSDITGNGTEHNPWQTIQFAIDNATDNSLILVFPDDGSGYNESITITNRVAIAIQGVGDLALPSAIINGDLTIDGASFGIRFANFIFNGPINITDTAASHGLQNLLIDGDVEIGGALNGPVAMFDCWVNGQIICGASGTAGPAAQLFIRNLTGNGSYTANLTVDQNYFVTLSGSNFTGTITHNDGLLLLDNIRSFSGANSIVSTANLPRALAIINCDLTSPAGAHIPINKTGTAVYIIGRTRRDPTIDVLGGTRYPGVIGYGQPDHDIWYDNSIAGVLSAENVQDAIDEISGSLGSFLTIIEDNVTPTDIADNSVLWANGGVIQSDPRLTFFDAATAQLVLGDTTTDVAFAIQGTSTSSGSHPRQSILNINPTAGDGVTTFNRASFTISSGSGATTASLLTRAFSESTFSGVLLEMRSGGATRIFRIKPEDTTGANPGHDVQIFGGTNTGTAQSGDYYVGAGQSVSKALAGQTVIRGATNSSNLVHGDVHIHTGISSETLTSGGQYFGTDSPVAPYIYTEAGRRQTVSGSSPEVIFTRTTASNVVYYVRTHITAIRETSGEVFAISLSGVCKNIGGTASIVGATQTDYFNGGEAPDLDASIGVSGTSVQVSVTSADSNTWNWLSKTELIAQEIP